MERKVVRRYWISFIILLAGLAVLTVWNINSGSVKLTVKEILDIIINKTGDETAYNIVWDIRLPRILSVIILGGALSVSGFLLQTFFGNLPSGKVNGSRVRGADPCCVCGIYDLYGVCACHIKKGE